MQPRTAKLTAKFLPIKAIAALFMLSALGRDAQAGVVVSGDQLLLPDLAPGASVSYSFDQASGFFQSDPGAAPVPFVSNDTTFQFFGLVLDANKNAVDFAQTFAFSPNTNETFGPVDFLGLTSDANFAPVRVATIFGLSSNELGNIQAGYVADDPTFIINNTSSDTFNSAYIQAANAAANSTPEPASLTLLIIGAFSLLGAARWKLLPRVF
jgi:hypothetical protein